MNTNRKQKLLTCILPILMVFGAVQINAQTSLLNFSAYTQNFDSMGSAGTTTPSGWFVGTNVVTNFFQGTVSAASTTAVTAGTGSATAGGNYNFGAAGV